MAISKRKVLKTALLPGIWPRLKQFIGSGFATLAYMIAVVYNTVRILPNDHPYLKYSNMGTYSIREAIAAAANHIQVNRKNIDQVIIFFSVIAAMIIMAVQFILLFLGLIISKANAGQLPTTVQGFFTTPSPQNDIAFRMLDLVFGVPNFFGSREQTGTAFHQALQALFEFYSIGILIVGSMIIIYLIVAIVAETAQSGIPFGQRFNKSWAPVRLILFFGLLIPISNGLNAGQYITLFSAKMGSGLASTGWEYFNDTIGAATQTLTGQQAQNVAYPGASDLSHLPGFMMVVKTCKAAYDKSYNPIEYTSAAWDPTVANSGVQAWAVIETETVSNGRPTYSFSTARLTATTFQNLSVSSSGRDIKIVFGVRDDVNFTQYDGNVFPACGEAILRVTDVSEPGPAVIQTAYYDLIVSMWNGARNIDQFAQYYVDAYINIGNPIPMPAKPDANYVQGWESFLQQLMEGNGTAANQGVIANAVNAQVQNGDWSMPQTMRDLGWGGAGIWYNKIAQQNGALVSAIQHVPLNYRYPNVMERIAEEKEQTDTNPSIDQRFNRARSNGEGFIRLDNPREEEIADTLNLVYQFWQSEDAQLDNESNLTGNFIIDTINLFLGTEGLFEICRNTDIHPLAQLSVLGKSLLDRSIQSFAMSGALGILSAIPSPFGEALSAGSGMFSAFAGVGLLIGFILFYVLPFLPFIYFFFAVGNWVKGIFEAMVAMPLWALAHLRIDGEGIVGDAAIGGYYLLFEVFIRPILIIFGLLAAVTIFAAMVKVLNETFYLVISNLSGHDPRASNLCFQNPNQTAGQAQIAATGRIALSDAYRGPIDEFFFTIIYTVLVYMIGTACFKLIDMIPNEMLRWINAEIPAFNDGTMDSAEGLMKYVTIGGSQFGSKIGDSIGGIGGGIKQSVSQFMQPR